MAVGVANVIQRVSLNYFRLRIFTNQTTFVPTFETHTPSISRQNIFCRAHAIMEQEVCKVFHFSNPVRFPAKNRVLSVSDEPRLNDTKPMKIGR